MKDSKANNASKKPKIAVPLATYLKEGQGWFLYNLGLDDKILEEARDWLKANSAYRCGNEDEPHTILDSEWENKKKNQIIMDYLFKKTDGKGASVATAGCQFGVTSCNL